ncbi:MAG: hypothetical protein E2P02_05045 [Acidobacteria bacterium]|nr:MAG: hypothetical protein E2P02_05045 [Acidobacteriota bacterium]
MRAIVRDTVYRFLDCGILESGFARARCKACGFEFVVGLSCKARCLCPSCHKKRELLWAHWAGEQLLEDVPHRQVVFSLPKRLRIFFRYDRKLLGELAGCAWRALRLYFQIYFDREPPFPCERCLQNRPLGSGAGFLGTRPKNQCTNGLFRLRLSSFTDGSFPRCSVRCHNARETELEHGIGLEVEDRLRRILRGQRSRNAAWRELFAAGYRAALPPSPAARTRNAGE